MRHISALLLLTLLPFLCGDSLNSPAPSPPSRAAWTFSKGNAVTKGGTGIYLFAALLDAQGWTITQSGGGTGSGCYQADGTCATQAALEDVASSWLILTRGTRSLLFLRDAASTDTWTILYSKAAGYGTASADEDTIPDAPADEKAAWGTRAGGGAALFAGLAHTCDLGADAAAPNAYLSCHDGAGTMYAHILLDLQWKHAPGDTDPWVIFASTANTITGVAARGYLGAVWAPLSGLCPYSVGGAKPYGYGPDPVTGADVLPLVQWGRGYVMGLGGWKGTSSWIRCGTGSVGAGGGGRLDGDTYTLTGAADYLQRGSATVHVVLPWDGSASGTLYQAEDPIDGPP